MATPLTLAAAARLAPAKVLDLRLRPEALNGLDGYDTAWALVRANGRPLGFAEIPLHDGAASAAVVHAALADQLPNLSSEPQPCPDLPGPLPLLTVAVCTRDRPDDLRRCLDAVCGLDYEALELLIVDNAPSDDATRRLCADYPAVAYVEESRPGLNWARNRAVREASGEILAFTDDDACPDPDWARAIVAPFLRDLALEAVAGLVVPSELETPAQVAFERYGGLCGGFDAFELRGEPSWGTRGFWHYVLAAQHGSGANMAFRRTVFDRVGLFDPALDVGTPSNGGGDTEMLFRVMAEGGRFRYEPCAIVRHRHRRSFDALARQVEGWGSGVAALLTRSAVAYPYAAWVFTLLGARAFGLHLFRLATERETPRRLLLAELRGLLAGPARYVRGRRLAAATERAFEFHSRLAS